MTNSALKLTIWFGGTVIIAGGSAAGVARDALLLVFSCALRGLKHPTFLTRILHVTPAFDQAFFDSWPIKRGLIVAINFLGEGQKATHPQRVPYELTIS